MNNEYLKMNRFYLIFKFFCFFTVIFAVVFSFFACQQSGENPSPIDEVKMKKSNLERDLSPTLASGELNQLVEGNTAFALDFYSEVKEAEQGNFLFSPHSLSVAFAMTYAGARNNTELQMAQTLHFDLSQERLHSAFNALDLELKSRGKDAGNSEGTDFKLNIVNATWSHDGYPFLPDFLDILAVNYGAGMYILDFLSDPEGSRQTINNWVARQTEHKIMELLPKDSINPDTRLVLTNAIYFYGAWAIPFDEELSESGHFYLADGDVISVPMMSFSPRTTEGATLPAVVLDGYTAVELPYKGSEIAMLILVPDPGRFSEFEQALDANLIKRTVDSLTRWDLQLEMPTFEYRSRYQLGSTLCKMGMPDVFDLNNADFSGIDGTRSLFIGEAFHEAVISVDEKGTEATAATAVVIDLSAAPNSLTVTIDRPFIYLIRDIQTNAILFIGRVMNPNE